MKGKGNLRLRLFFYMSLLLAFGGYLAYLERGRQNFERWAQVRSKVEVLLKDKKAGDALNLLSSDDGIPEVARPAVVLLKVRCLQILGRGDESHQLIQQALQKFADDAGLLNEAGLQSLKGGNPASASMYFRKAFSLASSRLEIRRNVWTADKEVLIRQVLQLPRKLVAEQNDTARPNVWKQMHDEMSILQEYGEKTFQAFPDSPEAGRFACVVADFLLDPRLPKVLQRRAEAQNLLQRAMQRPNAPPEIAQYLLSMLFKEGKLLAAKKLLSKARKKFPEHNDEWDTFATVLADAENVSLLGEFTYRLHMKNFPAVGLFLKGNFLSNGLPEDVLGWKKIAITSKNMLLRLKGPMEYEPKIVFFQQDKPLAMVALPSIASGTIRDVSIDLGGNVLPLVSAYLARKRTYFSNFLEELEPPTSEKPRLYVLLMDGMFWNIFRWAIEAGLLPSIRHMFARSVYGNLDYGDSPFPFTYISMKMIMTGRRQEMGNLIPLTMDQLTGFLQRDIALQKVEMDMGAYSVPKQLQKANIPYLEFILANYYLYRGGDQKPEELDILPFGNNELDQVIEVFWDKTNVDIFEKARFLPDSLSLRQELREVKTFWNKMTETPSFRWSFFWLNDTDPLMHHTFQRLHNAFHPENMKNRPDPEDLPFLVNLQLADVMVERFLHCLRPQDHLILLSDHGIKNNIFHHRMGIWMHYSPQFKTQKLLTGARMIDVGPTFLSILGAEPIPLAEGKSLWKPGSQAWKEF